MSLSAAQHAERATGIGGSDAAAVCGLNPYKSPVDVYLEKIGAATPVDETERMFWGNKLEDVVAEVYAARTGRKVRRANTTRRHKRHGFMVGNIDRDVVGERRLLECKTADKWTMGMWGEPGSDEVPDYYLMQVAHYMAVLDYEVADLAVLIGGNDFRIYTIPRDCVLEASLVEREYDFWTRHVVPEVPPPPTREADLRTLFPRDCGASIEATPDMVAALEQLRTLKAALKQSETEAEELELRIKTFMADSAELLLGPDGKKLATWKSAKDSQRLDTKALEAELPDVARAYLKTIPGSRRFLIAKP